MLSTAFDGVAVLDCASLGRRVGKRRTCPDGGTAIRRAITLAGTQTGERRCSRRIQPREVCLGRGLRPFFYARRHPVDRRRSGAGRLRLCSGPEVVGAAPPELDASRLRRPQRILGPSRDHSALLFSRRGIEVQHERIGSGAQLRGYERHLEAMSPAMKATFHDRRSSLVTMIEQRAFFAASSARWLPAPKAIVFLQGQINPRGAG